MAGVAEDQGLALSRDHDLNPFRWRPSVLVEVGQFPYVVYVYPVGGAAEFALFRSEPLHQFGPVVPDSVRGVRKMFDHLPFQRDAAPRRDEWWQTKARPPHTRPM